MPKTDSTLDSLWQTTTGAPLDPTPEPSEPSVEPLPPAADDVMARRMGAIEGSVAALANMMQMMAARSSVTPPGPGKPAEPTPSSWQDKDFLTPADVQTMLDSNEPHAAFNRAINAAVRTAYDDVTGRIGNLNREIGTRLEAQTNAYVAVESQRRQETTWQEFFTGYPDLSEFRDMAEIEAIKLAREYQANPYMAAGLTRDQVWGEVANRVRGRLDKIRAPQEAGAAQGEGQGSLLSPSTRRPSTFMERGGAARSQSARSKPRPGSPEAMLSGMDDHVRRSS